MLDLLRATILKPYYVCLSSLFLCTPELHAVSEPTDAEYTALVAALAPLRAQAIWPVSGSSRDAIDETFGPRFQVSTQKYDWHRGLDIDSLGGTTTTIVAPLDGVFVRYSYLSSSSGWTLEIKHPLPQSFSYGGKTIQNVYSYYLHLDDAGTPEWIKTAQADQTTPDIPKGTIIATMGNSGSSGGDAYDVHLHWELRIGSRSSLEYQLANFDVNSNSFYGFDPHMHPLMLFDPLAAPIELTQAVAPTPLNDGLLGIRVTNDDQPTINRVKISIIDLQNGNNPVKTHLFDFNRRIGFDPSSTAALDSRDLSLPYFSPQTFTDVQADYRLDLVIPALYMVGAYASNLALKVEVMDIYGQTEVLQSPPPTQIQTWRYSHFNLLEDSGDSANEANPAGDGVANLVKFAFNLDPTIHDLTVMEPLVGLKGLPIQAVSPDNHLTLEFVRRRADSSPGISYTIQSLNVSDGTWSAATGGESVVAINTILERVVWTDDSLFSDNARILRVKIEAL